MLTENPTQSVVTTSVKSMIITSAETPPTGGPLSPGPRFITACLLPAVIAGTLLWALLLPLQLGVLAGVGLTPLLLLVYSNASAFKIYFAAWVGGVYFFLPTLISIVLLYLEGAVAAPELALLGITVVASMSFPVAIFLLRRLDAGTWPALLSGALLWLCFFPVSLYPLAWLAIVPMLLLVRSTSPALNLYFSAWMGGLVFFVPALQWMRVADATMACAWIALAIYLALYFPASIFALRVLDRARLPLILTVPVVWTVQEFFRSFVMTGFAWYFLGHSQHAFLALIQIADVTGVYGVTFLVAMVNALVFEALVSLEPVRRFCRLSSRCDQAPRRWVWIVKGAVVAGLFAALLTYGLVRLNQEEFQPGPRVALLQTSLDQRFRNAASEKSTPRQDAGSQTAQLEVAALYHQPVPQLIIWPETSLNGTMWELAPSLFKTAASIPPETLQFCDLNQELIRRIARASQTRQLFGLNVKTIDVIRDSAANPGRDDFLSDHPIGPRGAPKYFYYGRRYNTALLVDAHGNMTGRYDKIHRVPFGEYVPLRDVFPFLDNFTPYDFPYSLTVGDKLSRFALDKKVDPKDDKKVDPKDDKFHFGVLICFEDTDPVLARQYHLHDKNGPPVDFLVNISNDGWFDGTSEHEEHLAISRFRAIECRRAIVRAVNMGISAVIDSNGRVRAPETYIEGADVKNWLIPERRGNVPDLPESKWADFKKVAGVLVATVPIDDRSSLYALWGDWLPWGCLALLVLGLAWGCRARLCCSRIRQNAG